MNGKTKCVTAVQRKYFSHKKKVLAGHRQLTPVILATQEAEIRRIAVQSQPGQTVCKTLSQEAHHKGGEMTQALYAHMNNKKIKIKRKKKNSSQKRTGGVAQGEGPECKSQYCKTKQNKSSDTWYSLENTMLSEITQTQKSTYRMVPLI
jgi:hypothetical protein